jgi:hypothetical protein
MSSSEDGEDTGRIRFTTDGDYEDGQWMDDGEFYARGARQGRRCVVMLCAVLFCCVVYG